MASDKTNTHNKRAASRGGRSGPARAAGRSREQKPAAVRGRSDNPANSKKSYERYVELARAAASSGDVVESEYYYQHADHYFRLLRTQTV